MEKERTPADLKRILKAKMKELKPMIPRGSAQIIAKDLDFAVSYVHDVVAGRRWDLGIIESVIKIGKENLHRAMKAEKQIDKLLEKKRKAAQ